MEKTIIHKAGTCIVLLGVGTSCNRKVSPSGNSIPTDYCYVLRQDYRKDGLYVILDTKGSSTNGYSTPNIELRLATEAEIAEYARVGGPCPALPVPEIINNYQIY